MEPTEDNRRAWDKLQRARVESSSELPGKCSAVRCLSSPGELRGYSLAASFRVCGTKPLRTFPA